MLTSIIFIVSSHYTEDSFHYKGKKWKLLQGISHQRHDSKLLKTEQINAQADDKLWQGPLQGQALRVVGPILCPNFIRSVKHSICKEYINY